MKALCLVTLKSNIGRLYRISSDRAVEKSQWLHFVKSSQLLNYLYNSLRCTIQHCTVVVPEIDNLQVLLYWKTFLLFCIYLRSWLRDTEKENATLIWLFGTASFSKKALINAFGRIIWSVFVYCQNEMPFFSPPKVVWCT